MAEPVAVIGAGQMGNGIAHVFAQNGFPVTMIDVTDDALKRGRDTIASNLDRQIKKGTLPAADKDAILGRITLARGLTEVEVQRGTSELGHGAPIEGTWWRARGRKEIRRRR